MRAIAREEEDSSDQLQRVIDDLTARQRRLESELRSLTRDLRKSGNRSATIEKEKPVTERLRMESAQLRSELRQINSMRSSKNVRYTRKTSDVLRAGSRSRAAVQSMLKAVREAEKDGEPSSRVIDRLLETLLADLETGGTAPDSAAPAGDSSPRRSLRPRSATSPHGIDGALLVGPGRHHLIALSGGRRRQRRPTSAMESRPSSKEKGRKAGSVPVHAAQGAGKSRSSMPSKRKAPGAAEGPRAVPVPPSGPLTLMFSRPVKLVYDPREVAVSLSGQGAPSTGTSTS